jgi:hypothetical protein
MILKDPTVGYMPEHVNERLSTLFWVD